MVRKLSVLLGILLGFLIAMPAMAVCDLPEGVSPGEIVSFIYDDPPKPGLMLSIDESNCIAHYRLIQIPGQEVDSSETSMLADMMVPYRGEVPAYHPYACPFGPGSPADYQSEDGWRPAVITNTDEQCNYALDYYEGAVSTQVELAYYIAGEYLRAARLKGPSETEIEAAKLCPPGGAEEDFQDDSFDSSFKRAIIADISEREKEPVHIAFKRIREGQMTVVQQGDAFRRDHPDAMIGAEVYPFRLDASVCKQSSGRPVSTDHVYDYNCFTDKFGDFVCRQEAAR